MSELGFDRGETVQAGRPAWVGNLRRLLLVAAVTILCGAAYLAGIWTGTNTHITCNVTGPGQIVCGDGTGPAPPAQTTPPRTTASV